MIDAIRLMPWFGAERARGYSIILLIALSPLLAYFLYLGLTRSADFVSFWSAARIAWKDPALSYDWRATRALQTWVPTGDLYPFPNPPPFLLILAPFGLLPFKVAFCAFSVVTLGVYLAATRHLRAFWPSVAFTAVPFNFVIGQNGLLTGGLFIAGARLLDSRPLLAGALFGCLVIKPQLAVLVPVALFFGGRWRAIAGAAFGSIGALILATAILGPKTDAAFVSAISRQHIFLFEPALQAKMQTPFTAALALGANSTVAAALQMACALTAAGVVAAVWRADHSTEAKCAVLAAATPFATPYLYGYDLPLLFLPIVWLARSGDPLSGERLVIGLAFLSPMLSSLVAAKTGLNLGPVANLLLLGFVLRRLRVQKGQIPSGAPATPVLISAPSIST